MGRAALARRRAAPQKPRRSERPHYAHCTPSPQGHHEWTGRREIIGAVAESARGQAMREVRLIIHLPHSSTWVLVQENVAAKVAFASGSCDVNLF